MDNPGVNRTLLEQAPIGTQGSLLMVPHLGGVLFMTVLGRVMFGSGCRRREMAVETKCLPGNTSVCAIFSQTAHDWHYALSLTAEKGLGTVRMNKSDSLRLFEPNGFDPQEAPEIFFQAQTADPDCEIGPCPTYLAALVSGLSLNVAMTAANQDAEPLPSFARKGLRHMQYRARSLSATLARVSGTEARENREKLRKICQFNPKRYVYQRSSSTTKVVMANMEIDREALEEEVFSRCPANHYRPCVCRPFKEKGMPIMQVKYPICNAP